MKQTEEIIAYGHELIQARHRTTFEITKENHLTKKGDCIIAVGSDKGAVELSQDFKETAKNPEADVTITIEVDKEKETVTAKGNPKLTLSHPTDIVVRKSSYICSRTLAVKADKAATDFSRKLITKCQKPNQKIKIIITVMVPDKKKTTIS